ncbi:diaminobutyrate-2-oxoglutarate aminotransferase [Pseudomaricurvus sp. HS19]|nr:diaminobutyrate-2-oxoglutarate aminotransferase [Pseudomaricurvus sp. HS19]
MSDMACDLRTLDRTAIEEAFHGCFRESENTRLQGGAAEPLYRPARDNEPHCIYYTLDYAASALHEVAHWCVAGEERRRLEDYGYWYAPDGRSEEQQQLFETVEVRPQAMEWIFNTAAGRQFRVSADNLTMGLGPSDSFKQAVFEQTRRFCREGLPPRAARFALALALRSGVENPFAEELYLRQAL